MKQNLDSHDSTFRGIECQYKHPPLNSKLTNGHSNGNGSACATSKAQHTNGGRYWIPDAIFDFNLNSYQRDVFGYLCRRSNGAGTCHPSQALIVKELGISQRTVSRAIKELTRQNLISVKSIPGDKFKKGVEKFEHNEYRILLKSRGCVACEAIGVLPVRHTKEVKELKEVKENIIKESFDKHSSKRKELNGNGNRNGADKNIEDGSQVEKDIIPYEEILADLNKKAGTNFRHTTKTHRNKIKARWNEGNTFADFQRVHSNRVAHWKADPKMGQYLRPATLYSNKFEGYLNSPFPKSNGSFNHTPYKKSDNKYADNKAPDKQTIEIATPSLEEKTDRQYMDEWRLMNDEKRWLHDLQSAAFVERGADIRFSIHKETEKLNTFRVLAFKKKWKNDNRDVIQAPGAIISEGC